jgi:hypothetical protein
MHGPLFMQVWVHLGLYIDGYLRLYLLRPIHLDSLLYIRQLYNLFILIHALHTILFIPLRLRLHSNSQLQHGHIISKRNRNIGRESYIFVIGSSLKAIGERSSRSKSIKH